MKAGARRWMMGRTVLITPWTLEGPPLGGAMDGPVL